MAAGAFGIVVSTEPTSWLVSIYGWRTAFVIFSGFIACAAAFIFVAVPEKENQSNGVPFLQQVNEMMAIMKTRLFWRSMPMLGLSAGIGIAYQTLWAGPWLRDVAGLSQEAVARHLFWMAVVFMFGVLSFGVIADRLQRVGFGPMQTLTVLLVFHSAAQAVICFAPASLGMVAWLVLAATSQCAILAFAWFAAQVGDALAGRANATLNFSMFVAAFSIQYLVGLIISFFPPGATGYAPEGYSWAFGVFMLLQVLAMLWYLADNKLKA
jgi:predicted MFS family arabinose efflux permease